MATRAVALALVACAVAFASWRDTATGIDLNAPSDLRAMYAAQGFDPEASGDRLFVLGDSGYQSLTGDVFAEISSGAMRL